MKTQHTFLESGRIPGRWFLGLVLGGCLGLLLGSFFDFSITSNLFDPDTGWAKILAAYGPLPCFWAIAFGGGLVLNINSARECPWYQHLFGVLIFLACEIGSVWYITTCGQNELHLAVVPALLLAVVLVLLPGLFFYSTARDLDRQIQIKLVWMVVLVCGGQFVIVQLLKHLVMRPRFLALLADPSIRFHPWWQNGREASVKASELYAANRDLFRSFPSGHTASAACIFLMCLVPCFDSKWNKNMVFLLCLLYTLVVAFSRMVLGFHFLSDVSMGFMITTLLFWLGWHYLIQPKLMESAQTAIPAAPDHLHEIEPE